MFTSTLLNWVCCASCGSQRLVNARAERRLVRKAIVCKFADLNQGTSQTISESPVRRTLHYMVYGSCTQLTRKRLQFAQEHEYIAVDLWDEIIWPDESRLQLHLKMYSWNSTKEWNPHYKLSWSVFSFEYVFRIWFLHFNSCETCLNSSAQYT